MIPSFQELDKLTKSERHRGMPAKRLYDFEELEGLIKKVVSKERLTATEDKTFEKINQTAAILQKYPSAQAYKIIAKMLNCSMANAYVWGQKALDFFGQIDLMTAKGHRFIIIQRIIKLLEHADIDQSTRLLKLYKEVSGAANIEDKEERVKRRVRVIRTTDPRVLEAKEIEEYD